MRKLNLLVIGLTIAFATQAQTILTYKTHGLIPNEKNPMMLTKYVDPGVEGQNVVWNYTSLEATDDFVGNIHNTLITQKSIKFETANTVLEEFGNYFFFKSNSDCLEQYGYSIGNGTVSLEYSKPFVKMRYPFSFNSSYSGSFEGKYISNDKIIGELVGTYRVTGDGIGTLVLPNGKSFINALRVKEVKNYDQTMNGSKVTIEEATYRWYVNEHRFPILVLINCSYVFENGQNSTTTKAAYNSNVITSNITNLNEEKGLKLEVYPNPYHEKVNVNLHIDNKSKVIIAVYDLIGKRVALLADRTEDAGDLTFFFSANELGLAKGTYIIKVKVNNSETTKKIIEL